MNRLLFCFLIMACTTAHAEVYRWTDANGKVHFSDKRPKSAAEDITEKVMKQRMVKKTTIDLALMNKKRFERITGGKYTLVSVK